MYTFIVASKTFGLFRNHLSVCQSVLPGNSEAEAMPQKQWCSDISAKMIFIDIISIPKVPLFTAVLADIHNLLCWRKNAQIIY